MGRDHPRVKRTIGTNISEKIINCSSYGLTLNNFLTYLTAFISASVKKKKKALYVLGHCKKIPTALLCKRLTNFLGVWLVGKYQSQSICSWKAISFLLWEAFSRDWTITVITPAHKSRGEDGAGSPVPRWGSQQLLEDAAPGPCAARVQCSLRITQLGSTRDKQHVEA